MKNRIISISLAVGLILDVGLIGCASEQVPQIAEYNLSISSTEGGSVTSPGEGTSTYDEGTVVNLVAEANEGCHFVDWTGDVATIADINAATTNITMNGDYEITANFSEIPVTYYTLTIALTGNGSTSPAVGQHTYASGTVVPVTATPASGHQFVNWTGDVGAIANVNAATTIITMQGDYEITANFEQIPLVRYSLTITSTAGGSVTTPGQGTFTYDAGTVVSMIATPVNGYQFAGWTGDVATLSCACQSTTITMNGNYSITANFVVIPPVQYRLTVSSTDGGSVTTPGEGTFTYDAGTLVNLVATPASCYSFVNWTGSVGTIANVNAASTTVIMNGDYSITANFDEEEAMAFPDSNLEAVIREAIGKPTGSICSSDLEGLTSLYAFDRNITDVTGLDRCTDLTWLELGYNHISDISPLANLSSLTWLRLSYSQTITDISPLTNLINLVWLDLDENHISDISPLANLTNLTHLDLDDNHWASDISPLSGLTNLTWLSLYCNSITDISPLAGLRALAFLDLYWNQISDISPLVNLTNLTELNVGGNWISNISPLANLINLTRLDLYQNGISDIAPLVSNEGLGAGDLVCLWGNPLSSDSINIYIPQLQARGVIADIDYPCG